MAAPNVQAVGTLVTASGAPASVAWPTHATDDIGVLIAEGGGTATASTPSGWTAFASNPQAAGAGGTSLHFFWKRAASGSEANVSVECTGDHTGARVFTVRGCLTTGDPFDVEAGNVQTTNTTSLSFPSVTTTVADTLLVNIVSWAADNAGPLLSAWANSSLTSLTEHLDGGHIFGNGGGFGIHSGIKASAGSTGSTTATSSVSTAYGYATIAFEGAASGQTVTPTTAALTLATFAPTVSVTSAVVVTPTTATLSLATFAPTVTVSANLPTIIVGTPIGGVGTLNGITLNAMATRQAGDRLYVLVENANSNQNVSTGYTAVTNSPQGTGTAAGTSSTRLTIFERVADGTSADNAGNIGNGSVEHYYAVMVALRSAWGTPVTHITSGAVKTPTSTSTSIAGVTTTLDECLVLYAAARSNDAAGAHYSGQSNASVTNLAEAFDDGTADGNGGGIAIWTGEKVTAGATGTLTATLSATALEGVMCIAVAPAAVGAVTPTTASLSLAAFEPTVSVTAHQTVTPTTVALVTATFAPTVTASDHKTVTPTTASLALTTFAPTVTGGAGQTVTPTTVALALTTFAPVVSATAHQTVTPTTAALVTVAFAPTVTATAHQTVTPTTVALTTATFASTVTASNHQTVTPTTAALTITRFAPSAVIGIGVDLTPSPLAVPITTPPGWTIAIGVRLTPSPLPVLIDLPAPELVAAATSTVTLVPDPIEVLLEYPEPEVFPVIQPVPWDPFATFSDETTPGASSLWDGLVRSLPVWSEADGKKSYTDDGTPTTHTGGGDVETWATGVGGRELHAIRLDPALSALDLGTLDPADAGALFMRYRPNAISAMGCLFGFGDAFEGRLDVGGLVYNDTFKAGTTDPSDTDIATIAWWSLLFEWDKTAGTNQLYINGTLALDQTGATTDPGSGTLSIGNRTGSTDPVDGWIAAGYIWSRKLTAPERALISLDPWAHQRLFSVIVQPATLGLTLTAFAPTVTASDHQLVTPGAATLSTALFAPTVTATAHQTVTPTTASLVTSAFAPTVSATAHQTVTPTTASLTLATFAPTITASDHQSVTPTTASLVTATFAPVVSATAHQTLTPTTASLTLTTFAPAVTGGAGLTVIPTTASLTTTAFEPTVSVTEHQLVVPATASLTLAAFAPTVTATDHQTVTPGAASVALTAFAPDVLLTDDQLVTPGAANLALTTFAATVLTPQTVTPDTAVLVLTTFAGTVTIVPPVVTGLVGTQVREVEYGGSSLLSAIVSRPSGMAELSAGSHIHGSAGSATAIAEEHDGSTIQEVK